jgi:hypothetical protein
MVGKPHTPNAIVDMCATRASRGLRVATRQVMEDVMAKVIEFYIPDLFSNKVSTPAPSEPDTKAGAIPMWGFSI